MRNAAKDDPILESTLLRTNLIHKQSEQATNRINDTLRETLEIAQATSAELHGQGEQLRRTQHNADILKNQSEDLYKEAKEVRKQSHFIPISIKNIFSPGKRKVDKKNKKAVRIAKDYENVANEEIKGVHKCKKESMLHYDNPPKDLPESPFLQGRTEEKLEENLDEAGEMIRRLKQMGFEMKEELIKHGVMTNNIEANVDYSNEITDQASKVIKHIRR